MTKKMVVGGVVGNEKNVGGKKIVYRQKTLENEANIQTRMRTLTNTYSLYVSMLSVAL